MRIKKNIVSFAGIFAFLFAVVAAFAFTSKTTELKPRINNHQGKLPMVWVKFDCSDPNQVETFPQGNHSPENNPGALPNYEGDCEGADNICAVLLNYGVETTTDDANGNVFPTIDVTQLEPSRIIRCQ